MVPITTKGKMNELKKRQEVYEKAVKEYATLEDEWEGYINRGEPIPGSLGMRVGVMRWKLFKFWNHLMELSQL